MTAYGRLPHTTDRRDYLARPGRRYTGSYVTLETGFPPPWDQSNLGSCVAFGSSAALVYARAKTGLPDLDPSELFVYYAARERAGYPTDEDTGLEIRDGIASLAKDGVPPAADWPYDIARFAQRPPDQAYADARLDEAVVYGAVPPGAVDDMIASGYPVVIGFDVYESFESDQLTNTGVMPLPGPGERIVGGHCVVLVSTPKDGAAIPAGGVPGRMYRRARNSWGAGWGDGGWYWHPVGAMGAASDFWQVTTVTAPGPVPVPPVVDDADRALAAVLKPWAGRPSGWLASLLAPSTKTVKAAGRKWLAAKGL